MRTCQAIAHAPANGDETDDAQRLPARSCLIDGEAIVTDQNGLAVFDLIRGHRPSEAAVLCAFDLLELNGAAASEPTTTSVHRPPDHVAQEQADRRFPVLAIGRGCIRVTGPGDLGELVLTHHDAQHDFVGRASLAQHAGTLGCRHRHWWCPVKHRLRGDQPRNIIGSRLIQETNKETPLRFFSHFVSGAAMASSTIDNRSVRSCTTFL